MSLIAICKICREKFLYKEEDKTNLMNHIKDEHSQEIEENSTEMKFHENSSGWSKMSQTSQKFSQQKVHYQLLIDEEEREDSQTTNFRVSIEMKRVFGRKKIKCPQCGSNHKPITRNIHEKSTESSIFSKIMAIFWICCLSSRIFIRQSLDYIECKNCRHRFGVYDHKQHSFMPTN